MLCCFSEYSLVLYQPTTGEMNLTLLILDDVGHGVFVISLVLVLDSELEVLISEN